MKKYKRKAIFDELKHYCPFSKQDDFIEVISWANGEGYDIEINTSNSTRGRFQLTHGQFRALKKLIKELN